MNKIILTFIFSIVGANSYHFVSNIDLDFSQDYTFEDFLSELKAKGRGKFKQLWSGGVQSNEFSFIPYLNVIEFDRKTPIAAYFISEDGNIEIEVNDDNLMSLEKIIFYKCLSFDGTEFPAKAFKVKHKVIKKR